MGASTFQTFMSRRGKQDGYDEKIEHGPVRTVKCLTPRYIDWPNAREAFNHAVDNAAWESGHGGYTGTIAEKHDFVVIAMVASRSEAESLAEKLLEKDDPRICDKWGPAGCIEVGEPNGGWLFFGWASC